jgi:hypothetical protein
MTPSHAYLINKRESKKIIFDFSKKIKILIQLFFLNTKIKFRHQNLMRIFVKKKNLFSIFILFYLKKKKF